MSGMRCQRDLEKHVGRRRTRRRLVRAYDTGNTIDLRYASPQPPAPAPVQAAQPSAPVAPGAPGAAPGAPTAPPGAPVAAPGAPTTAPGAPVAAPAPGGLPAAPAAAPMPPVATPFPPAPAVPPATPPVAAPAAPPAPPAAAPGPPPPAPIPRYTTEDDERATAAAFREDLQAILARASSTTEPGSQEDAFIENALSNARTVTPADAGDEEETDPSQQGDDESSSESLTFGHDVFDRLQFANQYDVGPVKVDLGAKFDDFDRSIVKAETVKAKREQSGRAAPEPIAHMQTVEDLATLPKNAYAGAVADRMAEAAEEPGPQSFSVVYDVPLVPQQTGMSCWAAGAAMVVAWRDKVSVDPAQIAAAAGYWAQYANGLLPEDTTIFQTWRLAPEPAQSYTVAGFRELLERWGPLWTAGAVPGAHIRVVAGIEGDGTPDGTRLHILDPWEPGMAAFKLPNAGGRYTETYAEYERKQATLGGQEQAVQGIYVAHVREPRR